jgi:imidazolonepropionase-like amidohydrolase
MAAWYAPGRAPGHPTAYDSAMPTAPFADDRRPLAIRAGNLLDVEAGRLVGPRVLHVRDAVIDGVAGDGDGIADDETVVDLGGLTVLPGLIDTHSHLVGEVQTAGVPGTTTSGAQDAFLSVRNARVTLEAGVTTVRDLGTFRAFVDCALRDTIAAGELEGPRMRCAGAFITSPWGGGDVVGLAHDITLPADLRFGVVTTPAEARATVRRLLIGGADVIKCIGTGAVLTRGGVPGAPELSEEELRAAVEEAAHYGTHVAVHAHSDLGAQRAIRAGARSVEHGSMLTAPTIDLLADTGTFLSVDLFDGEWALEHGEAEGWPAETMAKLAMTMDTGIAAFRMAVERGVRVTYGTDSGVYPHELVARGLDTFVRCGMTPLQAIRSATVEAADCIGWADRVGTLAPGRFADLVAVDGDPLADVRLLEAPVVVVKGARVAVDHRGAGRAGPG